MQMEFFSRVKDPRVLGKVRHGLEDVLRIALIGVLCACDDYDGISDFIEEREDELREMGFLKLTNGVPSSDTVRRVVESVNPISCGPASDMQGAHRLIAQGLSRDHGRPETEG